MASVLLFDGDCGFCSRVVRWILQHERRSTLLFAALRSPVARQLLRDQPQGDHSDSVFWVDTDDSGHPLRLLDRSAATLRLCRYVGGPWHLLRVAWVVPRPIRDALYDVVARNRHRLLSDKPCPLPTERQRRRFLHELPLSFDGVRSQADQRL